MARKWLDLEFIILYERNMFSCLDVCDGYTGQRKFECLMDNCPMTAGYGITASDQPDTFGSLAAPVVFFEIKGRFKINKFLSFEEAPYFQASRNAFVFGGEVGLYAHPSPAAELGIFYGIGDRYNQHSDVSGSSVETHRLQQWVGAELRPVPGNSSFMGFRVGMQIFNNAAHDVSLEPFAQVAFYGPDPQATF